MVCQLALEAACRLNQTGEHLLARAADFPPDQAGGYLQDQVVAYQLARGAVFLQGLVGVFQLVREVECQPAQPRI